MPLLDIPKRKQVFSVPLFGNVKAVFEIPAFINYETSKTLIFQIQGRESLDVKKDRDTITALAAIVLLQPYPRVFRNSFKKVLKYFLKNNVDMEKSLALVHLLYSKMISGYVGQPEKTDRS
ncbi:hypothetical protein [Sphingobacterium sp.]|uniref:hypothetical protein n=1 Tax=Sphingobacterium sp. TaxID=341027 RepID=UPI00289DEA84|nr:hypothetical protein [Sphingobacterium sp.]